MPAYTIAAEIADIDRFPTPKKLTGYTGLCPGVYQSGLADRRGHLTHAGPRYLRWELIEAATHACRHPAYRDRYQRTKQRLGRRRGARVAQIDVARRPTARPLTTGRGRLRALSWMRSSTPRWAVVSRLALA